MILDVRQKAEIVAKEAVECPKCGGTMDSGFIGDWAEGDVKVSRWLKGAPVAGWFREVNPNKNEQFQIRTYCCRRCGFLESYARNTDGE